jgi:hypothetical protein
MAMLEWPYKDADEILDYVIDWTNRLGAGGDAIASSLWFFDPGMPLEEGEEPDTVPEPNDLTIDSDEVTAGGQGTLVWLSLGIENTTYVLTNRVTTEGGRTMDQSVKLKIKQK